MAEEKKNDNNELKYEDIINIELENKKIEEIIDIALSEIDESWNVHDTKDKNISVVYKNTSSEDNVGITRGIITMDVDDDDIDDALDFYYKYNECGYDDVYIKGVGKGDRSDSYIIKLIDNNHQICHAAYKSGYDWIIASRDFVYIKTRFIRKNNNKYKYDKIVGSFSYSIDDNHPFNVETKKDHIRAKIVLHGYILTQTLQQKKDKKMQVTRVFCMDTCGMIPKWFSNIFAPSKGMKVEKFRKNWPKIKETMKLRKDNNFKKDHQPLFDSK